MQKLIVSLCLALSCFLTLSGQQLAGTVWNGVHTPEYDTLRLEFGVNDTIYLEDSLLQDVPVAYYNLVAGQLNFTDLGRNSICQVVPATYEVEISRDSLKFIPVNDPCEDRLATLTEYKWSRSVEPVHRESLRGDISLYPNPNERSVMLGLPAWFDRSEYKIFRLSQQLIKKGEITREDPKIDVSAIPDGNYMLFLDINQQTYRLVIDQRYR